MICMAPWGQQLRQGHHGSKAQMLDSKARHVLAGDWFLAEPRWATADDAISLLRGPRGCLREDEPTTPYTDPLHGGCETLLRTAWTEWDEKATCLAAETTTLLWDGNGRARHPEVG